MSSLLWLILGMLGGASLVVQQTLNAGLRARLQSVSWAGFVSYLGGTLAMAAALAITRAPLRISEAVLVPPQWWLGGLFGAAYLAVSIVLVPRLGTATLVALVVAGQLSCSLVFDHFGWLGVPMHPIDMRRLLGALLLLGGVYLIRL